MASLMARSSFCFVPEGDSPESSRLFDAISALCTPVVLTSSDEGLLVPRSRFWAASVIVLRASDFVLMDAAALVTFLEATLASRPAAARRCAALRALRDDLKAAPVLSRAVHAAVNLSAAYRPHRVIADFDVLQPPDITPPLVLRVRRLQRRQGALPWPVVGDLVRIFPNPANRSGEYVPRATVAAVDRASGTIEVPVDDLKQTGRGPATLGATRADRKAMLKPMRRRPIVETDTVCVDDYEPDTMPTEVPMAQMMSDGHSRSGA